MESTYPTDSMAYSNRTAKLCDKGEHSRYPDDFVRVSETLYFHR